MTEPLDSYPHDLAGEPAPPPEAPPLELVEAWRAYEEAQAAALEDGPILAAAGKWRPAASLMVLLEEADAANPGRDRRSDGGIGDARHAVLEEGSDHNPWLEVAGVGILRARDFDVDGLDVAGAFERMRVAAYKDRDHPLRGGGYLIHAGRITSPDFDEWLEYEGENPHVTHGHVSVSRDPARFDDRRPWNVWKPRKPAGPSRPSRPSRPATPARAPAHDLMGRGWSLRGYEGASGPRVAALQRWLSRTFPAYAGRLAIDGVWGPATSTALREFARRKGMTSTGRKIGANTSRKLHLSGFRG